MLQGGGKWLCVLLAILCYVGGGVSAQEDSTHSVITPDNAAWLEIEAAFDLTLLPKIFAPAWRDNSTIYVPVGDAPIQIAEVDQHQLSSYLPMLPPEPGKGYFGITFDSHRTQMAVSRWDVGDTNQIEIWAFEDVPTLIGTYASDTTGQVNFDASGETLYHSPGMGVMAVDVGTGTQAEVANVAELIYPILSPDGTVWASHQSPATLILTEAASGERLNTISLPVETGVFWGFSPDSRLVVAPLNPYYQDTAIYTPLPLYDAHTGEVVREMDGRFLGIHAITFTPDSQIVAAAVCTEIETGTADCHAPQIWLWDVATGRQVKVISIATLGWEFLVDADTDVVGMAFNPDGTRLAVTLSNRMLLVYSIGMIE